MKEKEIITKVIFINHNNEDDVIFYSANAYELKDNINYPYGSDTTLLQGNKIIIDEVEYLVEEITVDIFKPESKILENNLQVIVYLNKIES